jgi:NO-binding membrane sensor protein with MHYT domain
VLELTHNYWLVAASVAVALMASFTGLFLTRGAQAKPPGQRNLVIVLAAIALGGGIWSMHFVAMLGLQFPIQFYYDALVTMISALVAILMVGLALLILHSFPRTGATLTIAGVIVGLGISVMHFVGMLGMELCRPVNGLWDYLGSGALALVLSVLAIRVAYGARDDRHHIAGAMAFAGAIVVVHYTAIAQTGFVQDATAEAVGPILSNQILALGVTLSVFLICGAFLLTAVTFLEQRVPAGAKAVEDVTVEDAAEDEVPRRAAATAGVPYEREGRTFFAPVETVAALRAEGHYTVVYLAAEKHLCPWSITEADKRLGEAGFLRVHRSYLVNPAHVSGFERSKDVGTLYFEAVRSLGKIPVSRSRLGPVREALGL